MVILRERVKSVIAQETGQGLVEYTVVTLLVAIPVTGSVLYCGSLLLQLYERIIAAFPG